MKNTKRSANRLLQEQKERDKEHTSNTKSMMTNTMKPKKKHTHTHTHTNSRENIRKKEAIGLLMNSSLAPHKKCDASMLKSHLKF